MKKLELLFITVSIVGIIQSLLNFKDAWFFIAPCLLLLGLLYNPLGFATLNDFDIPGIFKNESYKNTPGPRLAGTFLAGIALGQVPLALLFNLRNFPLGDTMAITGALSVTLVLIILIIKSIKKAERFYTQNIIRFSIGLMIALILIFTDFSLQT